MEYHSFLATNSKGNCRACAEPVEQHASRPTIIAASGSVFDMGAGMELTIRPRCTGSNRRERSEYAANRAEVVFSHCKRHGAEPLAADDLAPIV